MKLKAREEQLVGDFLDITVKDWRGRCKKRLLPQEGWEELEPGFYMLSKTRLWVRPLFLLRKKGTLFGFEGRETAEKERGK